jgi:hypothetical protein
MLVLDCWEAISARVYELMAHLEMRLPHAWIELAAHEFCDQLSLEMAIE